MAPGEWQRTGWEVAQDPVLGAESRGLMLRDSQQLATAVRQSSLAPFSWSKDSDWGVYACACVLACARVCM